MRYAVLAVLVLVGGCDNPAAPVTPIEMVDAAPLEAPDVYAEWYQEVASCIPAIGRFEDVVWTSAASLTEGRVDVAALVVFPDSIAITDAVVMDEPVVKREMAHHILQRGDDIASSGVFEKCVPDEG